MYHNLHTSSRSVRSPFTFKTAIPAVATVPHQSDCLLLWWLGSVALHHANTHTRINQQNRFHYNAKDDVQFPCIIIAPALSAEPEMSSTLHCTIMRGWRRCHIRTIWSARIVKMHRPRVYKYILYYVPCSPESKLYSGHTLSRNRLPNAHSPSRPKIRHSESNRRFKRFF